MRSMPSSSALAVQTPKLFVLRRRLLVTPSLASALHRRQALARHRFRPSKRTCSRPRRSRRAQDPSQRRRRRTHACSPWRQLPHPCRSLHTRAAAAPRAFPSCCNVTRSCKAIGFWRGSRLVSQRDRPRAQNPSSWRCSRSAAPTSTRLPPPGENLPGNAFGRALVRERSVEARPHVEGDVRPCLVAAL